MFTIDQIKHAHSKVKSGADFPRYIQELKMLGVISYETFVTEGRTFYNGGGSSVSSDAKYPPLAIHSSGDKGKLEHALSIHQAGKTDYLTFCKQAADAGVEKWEVSLVQMTCTYYDRTGKVLLVEDIPLQ